MKPPVSILGLGIIGSIWAENLRTDGLPVKVWNRTPKPDAPGWCATAAEAIADSEFIFLVVSDPAACQSVLDAIKPTLHQGQVVIQSSTICPASTRQFAEQVTATGAAFLEAPFTGSKPAAEARETVFFCGGPEELVACCRPVMERLSKAIQHIGDIGSASTIKLALNMNAANIAQSLSETLHFARANGISDKVYFDSLGKNVSHTLLADLKQPKLEEQDWAPQFSVKHMDKDLRLALETAGDMSLPSTRATKATYEAGIAAGLADEDFIALYKLLKE